MKFKIFCLIFILLLINIFAEHSKDNFLFEIKTSYFVFQDDTARKVYSGGTFMPSLEGNYRLYKNLHLFSEAAFLYKDGTTEDVNSKATLILVPISLGLKPIFDVTDQVKIYFKAAPNWYYVREKLKYPFLKRSKSETGFGATFGVGTLKYLSCSWVLDIFVNYLYDRKTIRDSTSDIKFKRYIGGFQAGAGIGYSF